MSRSSGVRISDRRVQRYVEYGGIIENMLEMDLSVIKTGELLDVALGDYYDGGLFELLTQYNYHYKSLIEYVDNLLLVRQRSGSWIISTFRELRDYANMMSQMSYKFDKYPQKFDQAHLTAIKNYNAFKKLHNEELFGSRYNPKLEASLKDYRVIYPKTIQDIKDEAVSQSHCVASYIDRVIDGKTNILFLRRKDKLNESLITLQVTDNKVIQAKGKHNRYPTEEEQKIINLYKTKVLKERCVA